MSFLSFTSHFLIKITFHPSIYLLFILLHYVNILLPVSALNIILTFIFLFMVHCNIFKSFSWPFAVPFLYSPYPHRTLFNKLDDKNSTFLPQHYAQTIRLQNYITVRLHIIANKSFTKGSVQYPSQLYVTSGARLSYSTFSANFRPQTVS